MKQFTARHLFWTVLLSSLPSSGTAFTLKTDVNSSRIARSRIIDRTSIRTSSSPHQVAGLNMSTSSTEQMNEAKSLISNAISIGAPAYNAGDIAECARVYKEAAQEISSLLPTILQNDLQEVIAFEHEDSNAEAWSFRKQFDSIIGYQIPFMPESRTSNDKGKNNYKREEFSNTMIPSEPLVVLDNVMGGMSQGRWRTDSNTFCGITSLANNGGFSSLRWRMKTLQNWSYAKGIYLQVKHSNPEAHTFRLILKDATCEQVRGANFKIVFSNPGQTEDPIFIPFEAFDQIEQMGRVLSGPVFNRGAVTEVGLMAIKPTVVGEFELQIIEWGLYL